jgi:hypothetical protein
VSPDSIREELKRESTANRQQTARKVAENSAKSAQNGADRDTKPPISAESVAIAPRSGSNSSISHEIKAEF